MLHWPHSLFNRLKGGGMCAQICSMSCWGPNPQVGSLYKTTQPEGKATTCSWSTGAALLSLIQHKKRKKQSKKKTWPCDTQTNTEVCTNGGHSFLFFCFSLQQFLTKLQSKHSSGRNKGKHRLLWRVCGEWLTVWGGHSWYIDSFFFLSSCRMRCFKKPSPPPRAHLLSWQPNKWLLFLLTPTFDPWALSCPAERGRWRRLPGSITSFPLKRLKRLAV